jgi:AcrR family transcriptional regulator
MAVEAEPVVVTEGLAPEEMVTRSLAAAGLAVANLPAEHLGHQSNPETTVDAHPLAGVRQLDVLVRAAMDLLDESGLDAVTLRSVAARVGVRNNTVCWHVKTKARLRDLMADAVLAEVDTASLPEQWRDRVLTLAARYRQALLKHRDGGRLVTATPTPEPAALKVTETLVTALLDGGLPEPAAAWTCWTILHFTLGLVQEEQGTPAAIEPAVSAGHYPALTKVLPFITGTEFESRFRYGLELLLDSAARQP